MRIAYYAGASTAAAAACLLKAFHERPNFYSATVYLSQSNACLLILTNLLLVGACAFMFALQRLLYGPLRPIEVEHLSEKAWYAVLDTLLAMPSFREDVGGWLLTMFVLLLAGKVWGWIGEGRVDILEQQPPANPKLFHIRLATSLVVSVFFNAWMAWYCVDAVMANPRPGMMVIFTFEFAVQIVLSTFTLLRYCLAVAEIKVVKQQTQEAIEARKLEIQAERAEARQNQTEEGRPAPASPVDEEPIEVDENEVDVPGWEDKRRWLFGLEVTTDFIKLMIYVVFLTVSITFNGLPMHIMRDVYLTFASFMKRVNDYMQYRRATSDMNTRYSDATTEEIRGDACIVCRENMFAWEQPQANAPAQPAEGQPARAPVRRDEGLRAKKLPCGHILHLRCLKSWLERQQMCPTCRRPVVTAPPPNPQGQAGAAQGANPPAAQGAQQGQPQNGRPPVRARFFNLGPVRIGFANGPAGQMNDIVNQMRNPQAQANQAGAQPAAQQGPNHLGLQDPYPPQAHGTAMPAPVTGVPGMQTARAGASTQLQLMQIEQRILQDAQNLQLEQQQVALLRVMEAEMARLRAQYAPNQQFGGAGQYHSPFPTTQEVLHGANAQSLSNGHENLPQGMVLPEGWTLMPLHRQEGARSVTAPASASTVDSRHNVPETGGEQPAPPQVQSSETQSTTPMATEQSRASRAPEQTSVPLAANSTTGPTDERGSPLFVPAAPAAPVADVPASSLAPETQAPSQPQPQPEQERTDSEPTVSHPTPAPIPWSSGSWGFDNPAPEETAKAAETTVSSETTTEQQQPEAEAEAEAQNSNNEAAYAGKGKGRAVEVEDAPDQDA
jgi:E3 ubiquitin-protein ligase synoviolin